MASRRSWTDQHVRRVFWRAGFGATPQEVRRFARAGKEATLGHLLNTSGSARLVGPAPKADGKPVDPLGGEWGHDVLWWLDRMVRTTRPLEEKLTLFWHDHFATTEQDTPLMLRQNATLRRHAFGPFRTLLGAMTQDTAMLLFLSLADSDPESPNENFARELMELFTLGTGYSEEDIREASRALTGFRAEWPDDGVPRTYYDPDNHDAGVKRIFGRSGRFDFEDVCDLCVGHPAHAPFLVGKLWGFFVGRPLDARTRRSLAATYTSSGGQVKPVVAAILRHPALYAELDAPDMVKAPVVYVAGALRSLRAPVRDDAWTWLLSQMGQFLFEPPSVAGWEWGTAWMSSNAAKVRHELGNVLLDEGGPVHVGDKATPKGLTPPQALKRAWTATGQPWASRRTHSAALKMTRRMLSGSDESHDWMDLQTRQDHVQRVLRHLYLTGPDAQVC